MTLLRDDLPRARQLLSARALQQLLQAPCIVLEAGCDARSAYMHSRIPTARYVDTQSLETLPFWNAIEDRALMQAFGAMGIDRNATVIVYSRNPLAAARLAHLLLYAGVDDVRMLDGGFAVWQVAGYACHSGLSPAPLSATPFGADAPLRPHYFTNLQQARSIASAAASGSAHEKIGQALVSIRTWEEHSGQTSGYSYISAKGDIPGALWGHAGRGDVNDMSDFVHADGTMRSAADISAMWARGGIHPGMQIAFYCGTGWRASLAFFYAWLMGWEHISVFDGGWLEWSAKPCDSADTPDSPDGPERPDNGTIERPAPK